MQGGPSGERPLTVGLLLPGVALLVGVLLLGVGLRLGGALLVPSLLLAVLGVPCREKGMRSLPVASSRPRRAVHMFKVYISS